MKSRKSTTLPKKKTAKKKLTPGELDQFSKLYDKIMAEGESEKEVGYSTKIFNQWSQLEKKVGRKVSHDEVVWHQPQEVLEELAQVYLHRGMGIATSTEHEMPRYFGRKLFLNAVVKFLQGELLEWVNMNNTKGIDYNDNGKSITMTIKNAESKTIIKTPIDKDGLVGQKIAIEIVE